MPLYPLRWDQGELHLFLIICFLHLYTSQCRTVDFFQCTLRYNDFQEMLPRSNCCALTTVFIYLTRWMDGCRDRICEQGCPMSKWTATSNKVHSWHLGVWNIGSVTKKILGNEIAQETSILIRFNYLERMSPSTSGGSAYNSYIYIYIYIYIYACIYMDIYIYITNSCHVMELSVGDPSWPLELKRI